MFHDVIPHFSKNALWAVMTAREYAATYSQNVITPELLLLGIAETKSVAAEILSSAGITGEKILAQIKSGKAPASRPSQKEPTFSQGLVSMIAPMGISLDKGKVISAEELLLALFDSSDPGVKQILGDNNEAARIDLKAVVDQQNNLSSAVRSISEISPHQRQKIAGFLASMEGYTDLPLTLAKRLMEAVTVIGNNRGITMDIVPQARSSPRGY